MLVAGAALAVVPWLLLLWASSTDRRAALQLDPARMQASDGAWLIPLRTGDLGLWQGVLLEFPCDHAGGARSNLELREDGRPLGPAHISHAELRRLGGGRYSHWDRNLYFSASDGSDPSRNGRRYEVSTSVEVSRNAGFAALGLSLLGMGLAWCSPPCRRATQAWRERWIRGPLSVPAPDPREALRRGALPGPVAAGLTLLWCCCAAISVWIGRGETNPYLLSTVPLTGFGDHSNSLPGYSVFLDGTPRHQENLQTWDHVAMFNGARIAADMYANRPLYPFLVSLLAWALGVGGACLTVNLLAWAAGTWASVRLGAELAGHWLAGAVAGALSCVGMGWWFHVEDYSAHQLSFAVSAVGLLVLARSRVWSERRPAEVHAAIGAFLAVASLAYNSGLFLTAAYVLVALPRNRWWHVLLAAVWALGVQRAWTPLLNVLSDGTFDYYAVERQLFQGAMDSWRQAISQGQWASIAERAKDVVVDSLVATAPVLPLAAVGAWVLWRRGGRAANAANAANTANATRGEARGATRGATRGALLLLLLTIALPLTATVVYSPTATARGYLVFGAAPAVWALAGVAVAAARRTPVRAAALLWVGAAVAVMGVAVTWHAQADSRAVKLYMWGQQRWGWETPLQLAASVPTKVMGMDGAPAPALAGGERPMRELGGFAGGQATPTLPTFRNGLQFLQMLTVRTYMLVALLAAVHLLWLASGTARPVSSAVIAVAAAVLLVGPPLLARARKGGPEVARYDLHARTLPGAPREIRMEIPVAPAARSALLEAARREGAVVEVLTGFGWSDAAGDGMRVEVMAGPERIAAFDTERSGRRRREVDAAALERGLEREPVLRVVVRRDAGVTAVAAWQAGDAPGRTLLLDGAAAPRTPEVPMPLVELRVGARARPYDPWLLLY